MPGPMYPDLNPEELEEEGYRSEFERVLLTAEELPVIFSQIYLQHKVEKRRWDRTFILLKESRIYMSSKVRVVAKFLRAWRESTTAAYKQLMGEDALDQDDGLDQYLGNEEGNNEEEQLEVLGDLEDYEVYTCLNAKNQLKGPSEFGVVLRKTSEEDFTDPVILSFDKGKDRVCWVTAMRLAKYGKQLRENYKAFKNKQETISNTASSANINESLRSRVAMDFTGKVGRIVEDPLEAKAIAISEGNAWKRRLRAKAESSKNGGFVLEAGEEEKSHYGQPWYHRTMSREQATALLSTLAKHDGVFVVRGSRSQPGGNVLSLRSQEKAVHFPILMVEDTQEKIICYTIDNGTTKFFDICQLVEFYRLNAGPLPTRLTNHLEKLPPPKTPSAANPEPH
uniref:Growth factor receptor-bound protein 14 n=1 Tax=Lygus hesperus TaxID=30085 RepID=A0A0A9YWB1_LYGHE